LHELHARLVQEAEHSPEEEKENILAKQAQHLGLLLNFLEPHSKKLIPPIHRLLQNKNPTITFEGLWYLLKPGSFAYCLFDNVWIGCVIMCVKLKKTNKYNIHVWFLDYVGGMNRVATKSKTRERVGTKHIIHYFEGQMAITALPVMPRDYWDKLDGGARRRDFEERGKLKVDLFTCQPKQMHYEGVAFKNPDKVCRIAILG
jgi:hypothetical protein